MAPQPPDYSQYISAMTQQGYTGLGRSQELYDWAKAQGAKLQGVADAGGAKASTLADATLPVDPRLEAKWESTYMPLYDAQAADAMRMYGELPNTEEQYAGKFKADTAQAMDAAKATQQRTLQSYGLKRPGVASAALDSTAANQRAAAGAAAGETGRLAARNEARTTASGALSSGLALPQVGAQQATTGMQANQQATALPATAITTTAGAQSPSLGYFQASYPYLAQWGSTMSNAYNQSLAAWNSDQQNSGGAGAMLGAGLGSIGQIAGSWAGSPSGSKTISGWFGKEGGVIKPIVPKMGHGGVLGDILGTVGRIGGTILGGMYGGPIGAQLGGRAGAALGEGGGDLISGNSQYMGEDMAEGAGFAEGGDVTPPSNPNFVPSSASGSRGAITDDVPARLNVGEFVLPKDVVSWLGEDKLQKLIEQTRMKRQQGEHAKPEMGNANAGGAININRPTFMSEGARV